MNLALAFIAGFVSALVFVGVCLIFGAIWWFLSYSKHLNKKNAEAAQEINKKRKIPLVKTEPL